MSEVVNVEADAVTTVAVGEDIAVVDYLSSTDYEDGTLLDFFNHDKSDFAGAVYVPSILLRQRYRMVRSQVWTSCRSRICL